MANGHGGPATRFFPPVRREVALTDKRALRARMRAVRDGFTGGSMHVPDAFVTKLAPGLVVACYIAVAGEADPASLLTACHDRGCRMALPHVIDRATPLRFLAWDQHVPLAAGPYGLTQPPADASEISPDIILTPLVAFDRRGNRLGQGAGHYDRGFAAYPDAWRVGVAWSVQEVEHLVADPWDIPLHAIVTEQEWIVP